MRTRPVLAVVATSTLALLASAVTAAPTATTVDAVSVAGTKVTASGTALFDGVAPATSVGGTSTDFAGAPAGAAAGIELVDATIETLPDAAGLRFTWKLTSLPASPPPETTRYTWSFAAGGKTFQLQAKRTNMVGTTTVDDPAGHVGAMGKSGFFQLRGNCGADFNGAPISNCPHLAFVEGAFDAANKQVTMDVPFGLPAAPEIAPGAVLTAVETAAMSISAALQAGVSNTYVSDFINGWRPYFVGGGVGLATGSSTIDPAKLSYTPATLADGAWTGTANVAKNATTLHVRSCEGTACSYTSVPLG